MDCESERERQERLRRERLAASLRENLKRRKAQQRARASATPLTRQNPPGASGAGEG